MTARSVQHADRMLISASPSRNSIGAHAATFPRVDFPLEGGPDVSMRIISPQMETYIPTSCTTVAIRQNFGANRFRVQWGGDTSFWMVQLLLLSKMDPQATLGWFRKEWELRTLFRKHNAPVRILQTMVVRFINLTSTHTYRSCPRRFVGMPRPQDWSSC